MHEKITGTKHGKGMDLRYKCIGVDLAGILGDAWRAPKVGRCRVGWAMERGAPSSAD